MTGGREKTAVRLKKEANFYAEQFSESTYGKALAKMVGNDNIRVLTESFTLIAYGTIWTDTEPLDGRNGRRSSRIGFSGTFRV